LVDILGAVSEFLANNPVVVLFSLILSGWYLFSKAATAILSDGARLDLAAAKHWEKRQMAWAKARAAGKKPRRSHQTKSGNPTPRPVAADKDPP
jgi:hypothetical protein